MEILKVDKLCKRIGKKEILKDVSFQINEGDILAFIGPNGAGKTTTIKCILGLQRISSGSVVINGYDLKKNYVKAIERVGSIVEEPDAYLYLSGMENLKIQARMYKNVVMDDILRVVELVGLENRIHDQVSKYSLGMRQRLGIAAALLNSPRLLLLDEPMNGLDPEGIKDLRVMLKRLAASGVGILISSHNLSELESFCNRVCILAHGRILEETSMKELKEMDDTKYILKVKDTSLCKKLLMDNDRVIDEHYLEVVRDEEDIVSFIRLLVENHVDLYEVKKENMSLEEAFMKRKDGDGID